MPKDILGWGNGCRYMKINVWSYLCSSSDSDSESEPEMKAMEPKPKKKKRRSKKQRDKEHQERKGGSGGTEKKSDERSKSLTVSALVIDHVLSLG